MLFLLLISKLFGIDECGIKHCITCNDGLCYQCEDGYISDYYNCFECHNTCKQCVDIGYEYCTECYDGFYLKEGDYSYYGEGSCNPCSEDGLCLKCEQEAPHKCTQCVSNHFYDENTQKCVPCHISCATCSGTDETQCETCNNGYYKKDNLCKPCGKNCTKCENEAKCEICEEQTFLDGSYQCQKCDSSCKTCHGTAVNDCDECYDGFYNNNGLCRSCDPNCETCKDDRAFCTSCKEGKYIDKDNHVCLDCDKKCKTCTRSGECDICADGYYRQYEQSDCEKCGQSCATCKYFPVDYDVYCTSCLQGYYPEPYSYIEGAVRCIKSTIEGCLIALSATECQTCKHGYFKNNKKCGKCDSSCLSCDNENSCATCEQGFYLDSASLCSQCSTNCIDCSSATNCTQCADNYFIKDGLCNKCDDSCESCNDETNACIECAGGYYFNELKRCVKCAENCTECLNATHCKTCASEFFVEKDGSCSPCAAICFECSGPTDADCIKCDPGYYFSQSLKKCYKCNEACKVCNGPNDFECTECAEGYFLSKDMDIAPGKTGDKCTKCEFGCRTCKSTTECTDCQEGFYLANGNCEHCSLGCRNCLKENKKCTDCFNGYYISSQEGDFVSCSKCPTGCNSCTKDDSGRLICDTCFDGYYFKDNKCIKCNSPCETCTSETECTSCIKGHLLDGTSCNSQCSSACASCINTADSCTECKDGFILNGTVCLQCPDNCKTCEIEGESSICTSCLEGFYLHNGKCNSCYFECATCFDSTRYCYTCREGFYKYTQSEEYYNGLCEACSEKASNCVKCTSDFPEGDLVFTCLECDVGYFLKDNECHQCHSTCKTCDGTTEQNCLTCKDEFYFDNGKCVGCSDSCLTCVSSPTTCSSCRTHKFLSNTECHECSESCAECEDLNTCTKCPENQFLHEGKCVNSCLQIGEGWGSNDESECIKCNIENCKEYDEKCKCNSCNEGYYHIVDSLTSVELCQPCKLDHCKECNGLELNDCTECKSGFTLQTDTDKNEKKCVAVCDDGYFVNSNNECEKCVEPCKICGGINGTICSQCDEGYFLNDNVCGFFPSDCEQNKHCENENKGDKPVQITIEATKYDSFINEQSGGALRIVNCGLTGDSLTFNDCSSEKGGGGAVYIFNKKDIDQPISLKNMKFEGCKAAYGGAVYIYSKSESRVEISSCTFRNNDVHPSLEGSESKLFGGSALYLTIKNGNVNDCTFVKKQHSNAGLIKVTKNFDIQPEGLKMLHQNKVEIIKCSFEITDNSNSSSVYFIEKQAINELTMKSINSDFIEIDQRNDKKHKNNDSFLLANIKVLVALSMFILVSVIVTIFVKKGHASDHETNNDSIDSINA